MRHGVSAERWLVCAAVVVAVVATGAAAATRRSLGSPQGGLSKRPFCNAFTGCGRKRSSPPLQGGGEVAPPEALDRELSSRAELDELARHVLAQATLWEQLQQKVELLRSMAADYPPPASNALYQRRKRQAPPQQTPLKQAPLKQAPPVVGV